MKERGVTTLKGTQNTTDLDDASGLESFVASSPVRHHCGRHADDRRQKPKKLTMVEEKRILFVGSAISGLIFLHAARRYDSLH